MDTPDQVSFIEVAAYLEHPRRQRAWPSIGFPSKYKGSCCVCCGKTVEQMLKRFDVANKPFQFHHIDPAKKHPDYDTLYAFTTISRRLE